MPSKTTEANFDQRFWGRVDKSGDCWLWVAAHDQKGYGSFRYDGRQQRAHRVAWQLAHGPIPLGMDVCHTCDTPACVKPEHLFLGTRSDNMRDCATKGRHGMQTGPERASHGNQHYSRQRPECLARGERNGMYTHPESRPRGEQHGNAVLTEQTVLAIRRQRAAGVTIAALAREYHVSKTTVRDVVTGRSWGWLLLAAARDGGVGVPLHELREAVEG